jgi:DNA modification methylase
VDFSQNCRIGLRRPASYEKPEEFAMAASAPNGKPRPLSNRMSVETRDIDSVRPYENHARTRDRAADRRLARSLKRFGQRMPILVDRDGVLVDGHAVWRALNFLKARTIEVICVDDLSDVEVRALRLALNRLQEASDWDRTKLGQELSFLAEVGFELDATGFEIGEIDSLISEVKLGEESSGPEDQIPDLPRTAVTRLGDVWILGRHRLICGDSRSRAAFEAVMGDDRARLVLQDPPYDRRISDIGGLGKIKHREFAMASGEMGSERFTEFLRSVFLLIRDFTRNGGLVCTFMDWRHIGDLINAARDVFDDYVNMPIWVKTNGAMGSLWRSRHELAPVFKVGTTPHCNNVQLGQFGRYRTNVWEYAGVNTFRRGRMEELQAHATPKPVAMLAEAILDVTNPNDIVLDPFMGSGSTLIAAEKTRRVARGIEIDPLYCDTICRRFEAYSGRKVVHAETGLTFEEMAETRATDAADE